MSSNIRITKICQYCQKEFIAKMTQTRYCSHPCNSKAYKRDKRDEKIAALGQHKDLGQRANQNSTNEHNWDRLHSKQLLTLNETAVLLNVSPLTIRRWLKSGVISSSRLGKKHLFNRITINDLLNNSIPLKTKDI